MRKISYLLFLYAIQFFVHATEKSVVSVYILVNNDRMSTYYKKIVHWNKGRHMASFVIKGLNKKL